MKLIDIAMSINNVSYLHNQDKIFKYLGGVQKYILSTPVQTLTGGEGKSNLKGLMNIYTVFVHFQTGSPDFFKKIEGML